MSRSKLALLLTVLTLSCRAREVDLTRLKAPDGFHISTFVETPGETVRSPNGHPRMLVFSPGGVLLASLTTDGTVLAFPDPRHTGHPERTVKVLEELNAPHGLAFHEGKLYVAETNRVVAYDWDEPNLRAGNPREIAQLPRSGMHFTRTLL